MPASRRTRRSSSSKSRRSHKSRLGRRSYRKFHSRLRKTKSDIYHYKETINGGTLVVGSGYNQTTTAGGVWIMRLSDFPIFQRFVDCYEFARLNKCTIDYIPKSNMQTNLSVAAGASAPVQSLTGTLITAIDQIPLFVGPNQGGGTISTAITWENDGSNDANISSPGPAACSQTTCSYVRGLQNSRERELYKRQRISFYPAFYTPVLDSAIAQNAESGSVFPLNYSSTGCFERNIKKWVNINSFQTSNGGGTSTNIVASPGPLYYGPIYALDLNGIPAMTPSNFELFDVRFTYSISFKRLKGSVANNT